MAVVQSRIRYAPGRLYFDKASESLWVRCVDGWAHITAVSLPGRKHGSVLDFVNGFHIGAEDRDASLVYLNEEEAIAEAASSSPTTPAAAEAAAADAATTPAASL
jgi:hypothetical protein